MNFKSVTFRNVCCATTALASLIALPSGAALAQAANGGLEEIVVSATRRSESVLKVPTNISAVTSLTLDRVGVTDISGLTRLVPGLNMFDEGPRSSGNRNTFNLRGLNANTAFNNDDNPSLIQQSVSTYLDETPMFFPLKLVDMERVEVLRGPQGTLYGAGSVGGTIRFIPKKPDPSAFTAEVTLEGSMTKAASDPSFDGYATLNIPLSDTAALRVSGGHEYMSGFIDAAGLIEHTGTPMNPGSPIPADPTDPIGSAEATAPVVKDHNDASVTFLRSSLYLQASDTIDVTLNYAYQRNKADGRYEDNPNFGTGEDYMNYKAYMDPQKSEIHLVNGDIEMDLGFARLTSSTAYADTKVDSATDGSGFLRTNLAYYYFGFPRLYAPIAKHQKMDTFSQEVRLVSQGDNTVDWIIGAFYLKQNLDFNWVQSLDGISDYTNAVFGLNPPLDFSDILAYGINDESFRDLAAFGEVTWHVTDRLQVTGGVRVFDQKTKGTRGIPLPYASNTTSFFYYIDPLDEFLLGGVETVDSSSSDSIFKLNVAYDINDDTLVYATWAQGFRAGGGNALPLIDPFGNDNSGILEYNPDKVDNYELGIKGSVDGRISYSATLFNIEWKNFQTVLFTPFGVSYVANVPKARSRGLEAEIFASLTPDFSVQASYSYVDAETRTDFLLTDGDPTTLIASGTALPGSSKHSFTVAADYAVAVNAVSEVLVHADMAYRSSSHAGFVDIPTSASENYVELPGFAVFNASVSWKTDQWRLTLFGENLSNARGSSLATATDFGGPRYEARGVIRPRTIGVRAHYAM